MNINIVIQIKFWEDFLVLYLTTFILSMKKRTTKVRLRIFHERLLKNRKKRKEVKKQKRRNYHKRQTTLREKLPKKRNIKNSFLHGRVKSFRKKPEFSDRVKYFLKKKDAFDNSKLRNESQTFKVPKIFSISDSYKDSCNFLRKLFNALYNQSYKTIYIDYHDCELIDVDASICMDIILADFINYYNDRVNYGQDVKVESIVPINYDKPKIGKVLFSIGAFSTLRSMHKDYDGVIPFKLRIGDKRNDRCSQFREVHITLIVDYIIKCLEKMNRTLTAEAETNLYKVIGEVIINAEEHSTTNNRYLIGYFEEIMEENKHYGIFNLAILNFGDSIYESFKNPNCVNFKVVEQMNDLSSQYTKRNLFMKAEFEEETLWTLYALQEGVTRKSDWKRGNGSIRFIESFFKLKGDEKCDNNSKMVITSGHTRIIFDGSYSIQEKYKPVSGEKYKMMTFNDSGNIEDKPDNKFVIFAENYFPGTLISAKILINDSNSEIVD